MDERSKVRQDLIKRFKQGDKDLIQFVLNSNALEKFPSYLGHNFQHNYAEFLILLENYKEEKEVVKALDSIIELLKQPNRRKFFKQTAGLAGASLMGGLTTKTMAQNQPLKKILDSSIPNNTSSIVYIGKDERQNSLFAISGDVPAMGGESEVLLLRHNGSTFSMERVTKIPLFETRITVNKKNKDLFISGTIPQDGRGALYIIKSKGNTFESPKLLISGLPFFRPSVSIEDVNGDGHEDIILTGPVPATGGSISMVRVVYGPF